MFRVGLLSIQSESGWRDMRMGHPTHPLHGQKHCCAAVMATAAVTSTSLGLMHRPRGVTAHNEHWMQQPQLQLNFFLLINLDQMDHTSSLVFVSTLNKYPDAIMGR
uniref:Uncharacterized protein n=1 Tax=Knipowitschia caucasica TaxID=637954 RepID=A0AAV2M0C8_KNICA